MNMEQISQLAEIFGGQAPMIIICWFAYKILVVALKVGAVIFGIIILARVLRYWIHDLSNYEQVKRAAVSNKCRNKWITIYDVTELVELGRKEKEKTMESS